MSATSNSPAATRRFRVFRLSMLLVLWVFCLLSHADEIPAPTRTETQVVVQAILTEARRKHSLAPDNAKAAVELGRACFYAADLADNDKEREKISKEGISICHELTLKQPQMAEAFYYWGLNLGQLARTKSLGALKLVEEMEQRVKTARSLDAKLDFGGPDRTLGMLYRDCPGWPLSIGSRSKSRECLKKAAELCPDYPGNHLELGLAQIKWGEKKELAKTAETLRELLPKARSKFTGREWTASWLDWNECWKKIEHESGKSR